MNRSASRTTDAAPSGNARSALPLQVRLLTLIGVALSLGGLAIILLVIRNSGTSRAERVLETPASEGYNGVIRNSKRYWTDTVKDEFVLYSRAFADRQPTALFRRNQQNETVAQVLATATDAWVLTFPVVRQPQSAITRPGAGVLPPSIGPGRILPARLRTEPPTPLAPGQTREVRPRPIVVRDSPPAMLYRIPLNGDSLQSSPIDTQGFWLASLPYVLTSEGVFWVLPRTTTTTMIRGKDTIQAEIAPTDDLMFSPFEGKARVWRRGVYAALLYSRGNGLYLHGYLPGVRVAKGVERPREPAFKTAESGSVLLSSAPFGDTSLSNLYRLSRTNPNDAPRSLIPSAAERMPVEIGNSLFWVEKQYMPQNEGEIRPDTPMVGRVMTSRRDGSGRRIVWEARGPLGQPLTPGALFAHQGRLYFIYREPPTSPPSGEMEMGPGDPCQVVCLHPERSRPLGKSVTLMPRMELNIQDRDSIPSSALSEGIHTDSGYLYAFVIEERQTVADVIVNRPASERIARLYRIRLPE